MKTCKNCNQINYDTDVYCRNCGITLQSKSSKKYKKILIAVVAFFIIVSVISIRNGIKKNEYYQISEKRAMSMAIESVKNRLYYPKSLQIRDLEYLYDEEDNDCYVYITIRAYNKAKIMVNGGTYMVHIDNDEVESVATWEEAQENKLNGSKAASELYYQSIAGRKHYTEVDNKNQNYLLKHPYK